MHTDNINPIRIQILFMCYLSIIALPSLQCTFLICAREQIFISLARRTTSSSDTCDIFQQGAHDFGLRPYIKI